MAMRSFLRFLLSASLVLVCVASDDLISSTFAFDSEGWSATHDDAAISYSSHTVRLLCKNRNDVFFLAPPKFLGQQRALFGGRIEMRIGFYEYNSDGKDMIPGYDLIIDSDRTGFSLGLRDVVKPWDFVTEANVTVDAASGWEHVSNGASVSTPELLRTLSSLSRFRIRACYYSGHQDVYIGRVKFLKTNPAKPEKTSVRSSRQPGRDRLEQEEAHASVHEPPRQPNEHDAQPRPSQAHSASDFASRVPPPPPADNTLTEQQKSSLHDQKFQQKQFQEQQETLRQQQLKSLRDAPPDQAALEKLREAAGSFLTSYISGRGHALGLTATSLFYSNGKEFESLPLSDITSVTVGDDGNVHIRSGDTTLLSAGPMNVYSVRDLGTFFEKVRPCTLLVFRNHPRQQRSPTTQIHPPAAGSRADQVQQAPRSLMQRA
jgi:hypothetical protein